MTRIVYGLASIALAWLLMQAVHECGHVLGAYSTGGHVAQVVLHPLTISRTDVSPNPSPRIEIWAGPIGGVLLPLIAWGTAVLLITPLAAWLRFFAGFCLVANGCYLGYGVIEPIGDAEELVRLGTPGWLLALFGAVCITAGLRLWHGLGAEFGWGPQAKPISGRSAGVAIVTLIMVSGLELLLSSR